MKKILVSIVSFFTLIGGKIFASPEYGVPKNMPVDLYGVARPETAYGVMEPTSVGELLFDILKVAFIPVTLIIGLIVFIKFRRK